MIGKILLLAFALASWGSDSRSKDDTKLRQLTSAEITTALRGRYVSYSPPGWADVGIHEEFHVNGRWAGTRYGRGPVPFSGRWKVQSNQLCVRSEKGLRGEPWENGWVCRNVWRNDAGKLLMPHMMLGIAPELGLGPLELAVRPLPKSD